MYRKLGLLEEKKKLCGRPTCIIPFTDNLRTLTGVSPVSITKSAVKQLKHSAAQDMSKNVFVLLHNGRTIVQGFISSYENVHRGTVKFQFGSKGSATRDELEGRSFIKHGTKRTTCRTDFTPTARGQGSTDGARYTQECVNVFRHMATIKV
ncbi:hypothetical protein GBF38_001399 [Nibea albiflora]|uniref:Uncharacterized protein n=1 Tax=Nibea albiflora TaxID=240163 RepID=A0ACB7EU19_NIBAL|nr:hypothetical protein GBF38_001399 [Nibea albiflora]